MARKIQNHITGTESLLNGESMERAATRSPCRMIRSLVAQEETNTAIGLHWYRTVSTAAKQF